MAPWPQPARQHLQQPLTGSALGCSAVGLEPSRSSLQARARAPRRFAEVQQRRFAEWVAGLQAPSTCARWARAWAPTLTPWAAANFAEEASRAPRDLGPMALWSSWALWRPGRVPRRARSLEPPSPEEAASWQAAPCLGPCRGAIPLAQQQALLHRPHQVLSFQASRRRERPSAAGSAKGSSASGTRVRGTVAQETRAR